MSNRTLFPVILLLGVLLACRHYSSNFHATTEGKITQLCTSAALANETDVPTLEQAGGVSIGEMDSSGGWAARGSELLEDARIEAAENGGTHIVLTDSDSPDARSAPTYAEMSRRQARFLVYRVPPVNWRELPGRLRPVRD
jgi:hypothetical protein